MFTDSESGGATMQEEIEFTEVPSLKSSKEEIQFTEENKQYIIAKVYEHFGRPNNIIQQELCLYKGWNAGGIQRARLTTYFCEDSTDMFADTRIVSWFLRIGPKQICVYHTGSVENEPDYTFSSPSTG